MSGSNWQPKMTKDGKCPHGRDSFSVEGCGTCTSDYRMHAEYHELAESIFARLNGGAWRAFGEELAGIHPYILNETASAMALAILYRTYAHSLCPIKGTLVGTHPEHDGRLGCGAVAGALLTLGIFPGEDVLKGRAYWLREEAA